MMTWLLDLGPWLLSGGGVIVAAVALLFFINPALLLNKWVLGALAAVALVTCAGAWVAARDARLREEGAAGERDLWQQVTKAAQARRRKEHEEFKAGADTREAALQAELTARDATITDLTKRIKGSGNVSKTADAGCAVPNGFVWDHNRAVPRAAGRTDVQPAESGGKDGRSAVVLSTIRDAIADNYGTCARLLQRVEAANVKRYKDCTEYDRIYGTSSGCVK